MSVGAEKLNTLTVYMHNITDDFDPAETDILYDDLI